MAHRDDDGLLERYWEARRKPRPASPGFEDRVMAAVRRAAREETGRRGQGLTVDGLLRRCAALLAGPLGTPGRVAMACAGLALAAGVFHWTDRSGAGERAPAFEAGETRLKGDGFRMALLARSAGGSLAPVADGDRLLPGAAVQPVYSLADSSYVHLLSLDAAGRVSCYTCSVTDKLPPARQRALPFGLELEGGPGEELYLAAASAGRMDSAALGALLRAAWEASGRDLPAAAERLRRGEGGLLFKSVRIRVGRDS